MDGRLSFATVNLENLNLPGEAIYTDGDGLSQAEFDAKVAWAARTVRGLDADVVAFQELWHPDALAAVFAQPGLDGYALATRPHPGRIANALAVRRPHEVESAEWVAAFPDRLRLHAGGEATAGADTAVSAAGTRYTLGVDVRDFSRPVLHAVVRAHHGQRRPRVHVFVAHLKSKAPTRLRRADRDRLSSADEQTLGTALSAVRRTAEAAALRLLLDEVMDGATPVVVLGDLNDGQDTVTTELIAGPRRYRPFASSRAGSRADRGLYDAATLQQLASRRDVYFTYIHEGAHESLDHVLVSQHFYDHATARLWSFRQLRTLNDDLDRDGDRDGASDHAAVVATFAYDPAA